MKRVLLLLLLFVVATVQAQTAPFVIDSVTLQQSVTLTDTPWRYYPADDNNFAKPGYNDQSWQLAYPELNFDIPNPAPPPFKGIAWFRLRVHVGISAIDRPIMFTVMHLGASEMYLDGTLVKRYGVIKGSDNSSYSIPRDPFFITFSDTGSHIIAVRYCNYAWQRNITLYKQQTAGFNMSVGDANRLSGGAQLEKEFGNYLLLFFSILFFVLSVSHLFLFLFYRSEKSNLPFSVFCFAFSLLFLIPLLCNTTTDPLITLYSYLVVPLNTSIACYAMNWLVSSIFSPRFKWAWLYFIICLAPSVMFLFDETAGTFSILCVICMVSLRVIIIIAGAIRKKVAGARIIGTGFLLFPAFLFVTIVYVSIYHNIHLNGGPLALLVLLFALVSLLSVPVSISLYLAWRFSAINHQLATQLVEVQRLSERTIAQETEKKQILEHLNESLEKEVIARTAEVVAQRDRITIQHSELSDAKQKSDELLRNILPDEVAEELKQLGQSNARFYDNATILFTDFVNFSQAAERLSPQELVDELHTCFKAFDEIITRYDLEKIKTIGDAYMAVGGLPVYKDGNAVNMVHAGIAIRDFMLGRREMVGEKTFEIRVGIHSGSVVAGIVGIKKFAYDIWGDTVNIAARMEQNSLAGKINISENTYQLVSAHFTCTYRGEIAAKNKGMMKMYFAELQESSSG